MQETQMLHMWQDAPDVAVQSQQVETAHPERTEETLQSKDCCEEVKDVDLLYKKCSCTVNNKQTIKNNSLLVNFALHTHKHTQFQHLTC